MPRRLLLALSLLLAAHVAWIAGDGLLATRTTGGPPADVAVVLGTTANPDGTLSERLRVRTAAALVLYREGRVRRVLVSGATGDEGVNEAEAMAGWLVAAGVPEADILVDPQGWNTWETAVHTRELLTRERLETVVAVSSYYHLTRTRMALERAGVQVVGTRRADLIWEPREAWSILREIVAVYAYVLGARG